MIDMQLRLRMLTVTAIGRLTRRFVWCSYMMHVYDGFSAHEIPSASPEPWRRQAGVSWTHGQGARDRRQPPSPRR